MKLKEVTLAEIEKLERERITQLKESRSKLEKLTATRAKLIFDLSVGGDKEMLKEVDEIEKEQRITEREIEIIETFLKAVSGQKDRVRADEVEKDINAIEELNQQLVDRTQNIDAAAEALVLAVKDYYGVLFKLFQINQYLLDFRGANIGVLDSIGVYLRKHDLWKFIKVGAFRDAKTMSDRVENSWASRSIPPLINKMRDHVQRLRGDVSSERNYCSNCYGALQHEYRSSNLHIHIMASGGSGKRTCSKCGEIDE